MLSFPPGTKMFQFPGCPLSILYIQMAVTGHYSRRVPPFGNLEIIACMQLPQAYRRLHVLHRHSAPRHPPDALYSLKNNTIKSPCSWMKSPNNINPFTTKLSTHSPSKQHQVNNAKARITLSPKRLILHTLRFSRFRTRSFPYGNLSWFSLRRKKRHPLQDAAHEANV